MPTAAELINKRLKLVADARAIWDSAPSGRLSPEQRRQAEEMSDDADQLGEQIRGLERLEKAERDVNRSAGRRSMAGKPGETPTNEDRSGVVEIQVRGREPGSGYHTVQIQAGTREHKCSTETRRAVFQRWLREGDKTFSPGEHRDLQADGDVVGGFLNAPMQMLGFLLKFLDNSVLARRLSTIITLEQSASLGVPTLDNDLDDADWTAEIATGSADNSGANAAGGMKFGRRELRPYPIAKRVKVSNKLLRTALVSPEDIVRDRLSYKFDVTQEKGFLTGDGIQKPLGVFTASSQGISTARDVVGSNTTSAIVADSLFDTKYSLRPQYQARATWAFHRDAVKMIRKLKNSFGQYLWQPGLAGGEPDTLIDSPVEQSEYVPNTFTSGQYVGIIGDWSFYWIVDALQLQIQRLVELYAESNQTGFIGRMESDGAPVQEEAFARVKLG